MGPGVYVTPEMAKKLTDQAGTTGCGADELVQDALAGYLEELALLGTRSTPSNVRP